MDGLGSGGADERQSLTAAESLGLLEEELARKEAALDACLARISHRSVPGDADPPARPPAPGEPVRLTVAADKCEGGFTWQLIAMFADGSVAPLDRGAHAYNTADFARVAGDAFLPERFR